MAYNNAYSWPSASTDFHPWTENTVFDPWLVESTDMKLGYRIITGAGPGGNSCTTGLKQFKPVTRVSTVFAIYDEFY